MTPNPVVADLSTLNHEAGHAVVAVVLGRRLVRVIGHHNHTHGDERGSVEWLADHSDPLGEATILLAGKIAAEGIHAPGETNDEREAARVLPLGTHKARAKAWCLLQRRDVRSAVEALARELEERPVLLGLDAEALIRSHLR